MSTSDFYPPAPAGVSDDLTRPTGTYRSRVVLTLASILVFLALYAALIGGSAYLIHRGIHGTATDDAYFWFIPIGALLLLFFIKVLFKRQRRDRSDLIEITEKDEPRLFEFLRRLVAETGAPFPKRVYLTSEVNAAVFYDSSILSLLLPVRKNLLIGLGAVNMLNLTELKAVLAHEFGHFSQGSMRLGSYVYVANHAIADMIWSRDRWDDLLARLNRMDLRIAWVGWLVTAMTWLVRQLLGLIFRVINLTHAALSRQMEFSADRMAVRATGSDALCHALLKLELGDACMNQTLADLSDAADHGLHTLDLFHHQERAAEYLRRREGRADWGIPPALPADPGQTTRVFAPDSHSQPSMWASHPPNAQREESAKAIYIRTEFDERPAWVLFQDAGAIRRRVTEHHMRLALGDDLTFAEAETVQRFVDDERAETSHDERYRGAYDNRLLELGAVAPVFEQARAGAWADPDALAPAAISAALDRLHGAEFAARIEARAGLLADQRGLLEQLAGGPPATVSFRGGSYATDEANALFEELGAELGEARAWLEQHDGDALALHARMAVALGDDAALDELEARYRFQAAVQDLLGRAREASQAADTALGELENAGREVDEETAREICRWFQQARDGLLAVLDGAESVSIPPLSNFDEPSLRGFLLREHPVEPLFGFEYLNGGWMQEALGQLRGVQSRLERLVLKGVGGILRLQEALADRWRATDGGRA